MGLRHFAVDRQAKVPVVRREEYTIYFEQPTLTETFIHCDVLVPWSASVARKLRKDWEVLKGLHGGPIRAQHTPGDMLHFHFLTLFGFHHVTTFREGDSGKVRDIYST